ncbi:MAG: xanthine dehydrogenase molybdopterin binding subunit [Proteobacteria bacterium]|nr:xanthine dehydrogenase molybdopterin binding subunit [Pseudomonadota bacterium]
MPDQIKGGVHQAVVHDSAAVHVSGQAVFVDDMAEPRDLLHAYIGVSERPHAKIRQLDLAAVGAAEGVCCVVSAGDIAGQNDISPTHTMDEPVFAEAATEFIGQPLFAVAAQTRDQARRAVRLAAVEYSDLPAVLDLEAALADETLVVPAMELKRGDADAEIAAAAHSLKGKIRIGGQEHFYLEGQVSMAVPGEGDEMTLYCSTQHPTEIQQSVARVLGLAANAVNVRTRRLGGAFGGKETQAAMFATVAALIARKTGRPVKIRPDRDDDMVMTGKRHDFMAEYEVGFDDDGHILGVRYRLASNCGYSADLSEAINRRALFHLDNCYYLPSAAMKGLPLKTNRPSNTAFRGFGGPQAMLVAERVIDEIAFALGQDPLEIRRRNFYGSSERNITPYHQTIEDNVIPEIVSELAESADYVGRRAEIARYNSDSPWLKKGIALTPVKFGIAFTTKYLNQAGALVHVYTDGSIHLNHGGTEMGQGLMTKVAQVVAEEFQVDLDHVKITATSTDKVPNTSATAASSSSDLNGMAARQAAQTIKARLIDFAAKQYELPPDQIEFLPNRVRVGNQEFPFPDLVHQAYMARVSLSATGFYKTPKIHFDRQTGRGRPFYYFAYGAAVSEATIDTLTGEYRIDRVDILHDVGRSLNPAIDLGQIEGGFIQGVGWLTSEELVWGEAGELLTHAPSTYKIPVCSDRPRDFRMKLLEGAANRENTIYASKAVGEPPLMLAISVLHALSDAVASVGGHRVCPRLDPPATPECILAAVERVRSAAGHD